MQRYDDRDYSRRPFEGDDQPRAGRYADEHRGRWRPGGRSGEGRYEPFGQARPGGYDPQEFGRYGGQHGGGYGQSGGGYDRERFADQDEEYWYSGGPGRGEFARPGGYRDYQRFGEQYGRGGQSGPGGYDYEEGGRVGWDGPGQRGRFGGRSSYGQGTLGQQGYDREGRSGWGQRDLGRERLGGYGDGGYGSQGYDQQDYGQQGYAGRPVSWSYTEIWVVPGPHTGRGPRGYRRSDERIREDVCERLTQHGRVDASDLDVDVRDGEVTLRGTVEDRQSKRLAEEAVEDVPGVRDVTNQIRVRQGTGGGARGGYGSTAIGMGASGSDDRLQLRRGMEVTGSDGRAIGKVKEVRDNDFLLERSMQRDVYVPFSALMRVAEDRATLSVVGDRIDDLHWETPSAPGEPGWSLPTGGSSQLGSGQQTTTQPSGRGGRQQQAVAAGTVGRSTGAGYRYGQEMAGDPRFRGRRWEEAEPELRTGYVDWARRQGLTADNDEGAWERLQEEARRAWDESQR